MEYVIETQNLCKSYGRNKVLQSVNMHVPKGAIYGVVGRNGAGKTTFIRIITGLQHATEGEYLIYGASNSSEQIGKMRKRVGAVVENPAVYMDLTAEDNIKVQNSILGVPTNEGVKELLELVGLADTGKKKAKNFSLGMKQRLGLAIALTGNPDFIILDEPINGLDPQGIIEIRELILKLNRERGITFLISSHILDELSKLATHYGFIEKGSLVKELSADEVEAAFNKKKVMKVTNVTGFTKALEEMNVKYHIESDDTVNVYSDIEISELVLKATEYNSSIQEIHDVNESLESYFMNLIGGTDCE